MPLHLHEESSNIVKNYRANIDFESSSPVTIGNIPLGSIVIMVIVKVFTAFDGSTPALNVGVSGDTDKYADSTKIPIETVGTHVVHLYERETADIDAIATISLSGATAGTAEILLEYATN